MTDLTKQLIEVVRNKEFEEIHNAFFEFCVYLDTGTDETNGMHIIGEMAFARAFAAALQRRGQPYEVGCGFLNSEMRRNIKSEQVKPDAGPKQLRIPHMTKK